MSFCVPNQPRAPGPEWARQQHFGVDSSTSATPTAFRETLAGVADRAAEAVATSLADIRGAASRDALDEVVFTVHGAAVRLAVGSQHLEKRDAERPFRVVLMGRTMAGKSTLFEFLTRGSGARIGFGAQRTTRDTSVRTITELADVEIVDTPGVGAMDGQDDYETAFAEVADADLILWVATDQATQEQTGRALRRLADLGKPILVALNCLADVRDEINFIDLMEEPERIFGGDAENNLAPIIRHLSTSGGGYLRALAIHAQAAQLAVSGAYSVADSARLLDSSRIQPLIEVVREQRDRTAIARRFVSLADSVKYDLLEASQEVDAACTSLRAKLAAHRGARDAFDRRARRRVEDADRELSAAYAVAITTRERWIEQADVDQSDEQINEAWDRELEAIQRELNTGTTDVSSRLEADLKGLALEVAEDWSAIDTEDFRDLGGLGAIWGNRAVKVGGRVATAMGGTWAGAKLGVLAGAAIGGPAGAPVGGVIGGLVGGLLASVAGSAGFDWVADRIFRSPEEVHRRRRQRVHDQLAPILDELTEKVEVARSKLREFWLGAIDDDLALKRAAEDELQMALDRLSHFSRHDLEPAVTTVDTELARELLRSSGRDRTAAEILRATRWRGAGMAVELTAEGFSELVLYPMTDDVERIVPTRNDSARSINALQIVRSLTDRPVVVHEMTELRLFVALGSPLAYGVREAWEALALVHTGTTVRITNGPVEGDSR